MARLIRLLPAALALSLCIAAAPPPGTIRIGGRNYVPAAYGSNFVPSSPSLRWDVIRDYHVAVFRRFDYPPETWTAWIPLQIDGEAKDPGLWNRMVTEDFLTVAIQTVWLVTGRITHAQRIDKDLAMRVIPKLQSNPFQRRRPGSKTAACMAKMAPYQLSSDATNTERMATFYLAVLAQAPRLLLDIAAVAPTSAWRAAPALISPAY